MPEYKKNQLTLNDNSSDSALWDNFRSGDELSFSLIFHQYIQVLYNYGNKFEKDEDVLKDCIQELFIKLYNNRFTLGPTDNIRLYLFKSLKNKLLDRFGTTKRVVSLFSKEVEFALESIVEPSHDDEVFSEEQQAQLSYALKKLSTRQQEAIYLRYTLEMSVEEISSLLNMNVQSVRNLLHRSIEKLRTLLIPDVFLLFFPFSE